MEWVEIYQALQQPAETQAGQVALGQEIRSLLLQASDEGLPILDQAARDIVVKDTCAAVVAKLNTPDLRADEFGRLVREEFITTLRACLDQCQHQWTALVRALVQDSADDAARAAMIHFVQGWAQWSLKDVIDHGIRASITNELCDLILDWVTTEVGSPDDVCGLAPPEIDRLLTMQLARVHPKKRDISPAQIADLDWPEIYMALNQDINDEAAGMALEARIRRIAKSYCWRLSSDVEDDIVQDTLLRVLENLPKARAAGTFKWFVIGHFRDAKKQVLLRLRRNDQSLSDVDVAAPEREGPDPVELVALQDCLRQLDERSRRVIQLHVFEGTALKRAAEILGVTYENARMIKMRAMLRLRACLKARLIPMPG
ncbi:MAG: sigma-70 family RNA polymerase sigma factor [Deltaproteobacteria bacterium]|nr:sigma-70 family RNA polymerase sigma factor [Deltaproteobacteria bacterium]